MDIPPWYLGPGQHDLSWNGPSWIWIFLCPVKHIDNIFFLRWWGSVQDYCLDGTVSIFKSNLFVTMRNMLSITGCHSIYFFPLNRDLMALGYTSGVMGLISSRHLQNGVALAFISRAACHYQLHFSKYCVCFIFYWIRHGIFWKIRSSSTVFYCC